LTLESLRFLATPDGEALLAETAQLPNDRLTRISRLRRRMSPELAESTVLLLELRHRARTKFSDAERMFFTSEGLEQASSETVAAWRSAQFPAEVGVLDACCGIGGDARAFGQNRRVVAVDNDPTTAECAALNLRELSDASAVRADVTELDLQYWAGQGIGSAFFDPSRRVTDQFGRRVRAASASDYSPPLDFFAQLCAHFPFASAKVSPAIDDSTLLEFDCAVTFVSHRGECKEAVLWSPSFAQFPRPLQLPEPRCVAVVLGSDGAPHILTPTGELLPFASQPLAFLYEPDPAVIRAHVVPELAAKLNAVPLDTALPFLTSDMRTQTPFADAYAVHAVCPMDKKAVQREIRRLGGTVTAVKKRGVEAEPEAWRRMISSSGNTPFVLILTRCQGKPSALVCSILA
jgi:SAM-dependent methyltransferase